MVRDAIIFDFQGTLVDVRGVRHLIKGPGGFDAFHRATLSCPPNTWVLQAAHKAHARGAVVLVGTGMNEAYRRGVSWWLADHKCPATELDTRPDRDFRKDFVVKREMLQRWRQLGYNPVKAYDDNPAVIELWESEGIEVTTVPGWED